MKILGIITRVSAGEIKKGNNAGQQWQQLTVEGLRFFVPDDLQREYCRGQRVRFELAYKGDRKKANEDGTPAGYEADFELLTIEVVPEVPFS